MNASSIDLIVARQAELIAALGSQDATAITQATEALAAAIALAKNQPMQNEDTELPERLSAAIQQSNAAAIQVNYLMNWTRQRIGRIAALRGQTPAGYPITYCL